jgi:predicted nucleic acid-binding protein
LKKTKIFIDINFFLDFYRSNKDKLPILDELKKCESNLIFPDYVYSEFLRNRENIFELISDNFKKSCSINIFSTSLIRSFPEFKQLIKIKKDLQDKVDKIKEKIAKIQCNPKDDPIFKAFNSLLNSEEAIRFPINEDLTKKARNRFLLGNPPGDDRKTICDELIWETIISNLKEDLIIVSRDTTYKKNSFFLKDEYQKNTGKELILITNKISDALEKIGLKSSPKTKELEKEQEKDLLGSFGFFNQPIELFFSPYGSPKTTTMGSCSVFENKPETLPPQRIYKECGTPIPPQDELCWDCDAKKASED